MNALKSVVSAVWGSAVVRSTGKVFLIAVLGAIVASLSGQYAWIRTVCQQTTYCSDLLVEAPVETATVDGTSTVQPTE